MEAIKIDFRIGDASSLNRAVTNVVQNATRTATAEARKAAQARIREESNATKLIAREQTATAKAAAKERVNAEKAAAREVATFQREMDKAGARNFRERLREQDRAAKESARLQKAERLAVDRVTRANDARIGDPRRAALNGAGAGFMRGAGVLGTGAGLVAGAVGTGAIVNAVQSQANLQLKAAQLSSDVHEAGQGFVDPKAIVKQAQGIAGRTGIGAEDIVNAMTEAAGSGGGKKGLDVFAANLENYAELSLASGTKMEDLARMSAEMTNNGIEDAKTQDELMRTFAAASKKGNLNLRDVGGGIGAVMGASQAGSFEGSAEHRARQASAFVQLARAGGAKNAEDSITAARNLYNDLGSHEKTIRKLGVQTIRRKADGTTERVDAVDQLGQLFEKTGGDITKIDPNFGMQSQALFGKLLAEWKTGGTAGMQRMVSEAENSTMSKGQVNEEANVIKSQAANQFAREMETFKARVGSDLLPAVSALIPQFAALATSIAEVVKFATTSPGEATAAFLGLATAVGAAKGAMGQLGANLVEKLFSKAVPEMNVTAAVVNVVGKTPPPPSPNPAPMGAGAAAAAAALGAAAVGGAAVMGSEDAIAKNADMQRLAEEGRTLAASTAGGRGTPAEVARMKQIQATLETNRGATGMLTRMSEGTFAGQDALARGEYGFDAKTLMNIATTAVPELGAIRGAVGAVGGSEIAQSAANAINGTSGGSDIGAALTEMAASIKSNADKPVQIAGGTVEIGNVDAIAGAIGRITGGDGPKAQPPP